MEQPAFPPSYPMIDAWMETIVEGEEIKIIRHNIPDEDGIYEVYRDHKFLKKVKGNTFIDREPLNGPRSYRVIGKKRPPQWRIDQAKAYLKKQKIKIPLENEEALFYETNDLGIIMNIGELADNREDMITKEKEKRKLQGSTPKKKPRLQELITANVPLLAHITWLPLRSPTKK